MNPKPKCPKCEKTRFKRAVIRLEDELSRAGKEENDTPVEVIVCAECGTIISSLSPLDHDQAWKVLEKLDITP
jgi:predicted nucleic-acid-binding Zn-ribbon protein